MNTLVPLVPDRVQCLAARVADGVFDAADVHVAEVVARHGKLLAGKPADELVMLAVAAASAGRRRRHVCVDLVHIDRQLAGEPETDGIAGHAEGVVSAWPDHAVWIATLRASNLIAEPAQADDEPLRPLVLDGTRLYLQRSWWYETIVHDQLVQRAAATVDVTGDEATRILAQVFTGPADTVERQRDAVQVALTHPLSIIVGGPGTGKTWTIARLLVASEQRKRTGGPLSVALAAPTGKAAARMTESVQAALGVDRFPPATTLHSLLGWLPGGRFRHGLDEPLPHDLIVVDETSMVDLPLMARLLLALRPSAHLVLVGDPYQLASVEAGTVLRDVVGPAAEGVPVQSGAPLAGHVTMLDRVHRFGEESAIAALADAVRLGDAERAIELFGADDTVRLVAPDDTAGVTAVEECVVDAAVEVVRAARRGDAAAGFAAATGIKVLTATRRGPGGLGDWSDRIEAGVVAKIPELAVYADWYVGRPVLVTRNDRLNRVANGDTGMVIADTNGPVVALVAGDEVRTLRPSRLREVETWWAMTIHKSQGSEFAHVVVSLPTRPSPILTRELLYTAVTRAKATLTVVGSEDVIRRAIDSPVARASGLRERLWGAESE